MLCHCWSTWIYRNAFGFLRSRYKRLNSRTLLHVSSKNFVVDSTVFFWKYIAFVSKLLSDSNWVVTFFRHNMFLLYLNIYFSTSEPRRRRVHAHLQFVTLKWLSCVFVVNKKFYFICRCWPRSNNHKCFQALWQASNWQTRRTTVSTQCATLRSCFISRWSDNFFVLECYMIVTLLAVLSKNFIAVSIGSIFRIGHWWS